MKKIIAFAGRLGNGKTELANICEQYGYERLYFAKPLKQLIADLIFGTIDDVNRLKSGNEDNTWSKTMQSGDIIFLANATNIPIKTVSALLKGYVFHNTRDMLQIIGTDLIRAYNPDWHVNQTKKLIEESEAEKIVIDDVRFTNEQKCLEELHSDIWFVIRPDIQHVSHHVSEETLKWQNFPNIIINNHSLEYLKLTWDIFLKNGYENSLQLRNEQLYKLYNNEEYKQSYLQNNDPFNPLTFLQISKDYFTYNARFRNNTNIADIIDNGNKTITVTFKDKKMDDTTVTNALEIEDLKVYINNL